MSLDAKIKSIDYTISYLKFILNTPKTLSSSKIYYKIIKLKEEKHELLILKKRRDKLIEINERNTIL